MFSLKLELLLFLQLLACRNGVRGYSREIQGHFTLLHDHCDVTHTVGYVGMKRCYFPLFGLTCSHMVLRSVLHGLQQ